MFKPSYKRLSRTAITWLLLAVFVTPSWLFDHCPCSRRAGESGCCATADDDSAHRANCCHSDLHDDTHGKRVDFCSGISRLGCQCSDECPCHCEQRHVPAAIVSHRIESFRPALVATGTNAVSTRLPQLTLTSNRRNFSLLALARTSQQNCITLSRFLI